MIEGLLIKLHRFGVLAQMVFVALNALLRFHGAVVSSRCVPQRSDLGVAAQTFGPADELADFMALGAVVRALKLLMSP